MYLICIVALLKPWKHPIFFLLLLLQLFCPNQNRETCCAPMPCILFEILASNWSMHRNGHKSGLLIGWQSLPGSANGESCQYNTDTQTLCCTMWLQMWSRTYLDKVIFISYILLSLRFGPNLVTWGGRTMILFLTYHLYIFLQTQWNSVQFYWSLPFQRLTKIL